MSARQTKTPGYTRVGSGAKEEYAFPVDQYSKSGKRSNP